MFQNFPYTDMHQLNLDWIIKIAKDFLDQYTHIQQLITDGEQSLQDLTSEGLLQLQEKADNLETLLQQWYDTHSNDIAEQLTAALSDISTSLTAALNNITEFAGRKEQEIIESIPADYTELSDNVRTLLNNYSPELQMAFNPEYKQNELTPLTQYDVITLSENKVIVTTSGVTGDVNCGFLTNRDYIQFNENALYILGYCLPSFSDKYYALVINSDNGRLYQVAINDTTIRSYSMNIPIGDSFPPYISAYVEDGIIYIKLKNGVLYELDISTLPLVPTSPQLGNWTSDDIRFGVLNVGNGIKNMSYSGELRDLINYMESLKYTIPNDLFMYYNADYETTDFTGITSYDNVQIGDGSITVNNTYTDPNENYCGVFSKRAYMNFNEGGLYFIASTLDPDDNTIRYCLAINPDNGYMYSIEIGALNTRRYTNVTLATGVDKNNKFKAFLKNDKVYVYCKGALNVIDITSYQIRPDDASKGNWIIENIVLGIVNGRGTSKTLTYRNRKNMTGELEHNTVYYALGDSLTSGSYSDEQGQGVAVRDAAWAYPYIIGKNIGCEVHNLAIPGAATSLIYTNELPNVGTDATLITLMTGTNDYTLNSPLGTFESTDWNSVMGRIYTIVDELIARCPRARFVLISPLNSAGDLSPNDKANNYRRGVRNTAGWNYDDLCEEMRKFANKYGIEFVNMTSNSPVNTFNLLDMLPDYTHPTKESYKPIAQSLYSKLF